MREVGAGIVEVLADGADMVLISNTVAPLTYHLTDAMGLPSLGFTGARWNPPVTSHRSWRATDRSAAGATAPRPRSR